MAARRTPTERLCDQMADGCPSLSEAAYRLRLPVAEAEKLWRRVCRDLGVQAS